MNEPENYWCEMCGERIREDDEYYDIDDHILCLDCVLDYLDEYCAKKNDEGRKVYIVNDYEYDEDEIGSLLRESLRVKEVPDEDEGDPFDEPEYRWE